MVGGQGQCAEVLQRHGGRQRRRLRHPDVWLDAVTEPTVVVLKLGQRVDDRLLRTVLELVRKQRALKGTSDDLHEIGRLAEGVR